MDGIAGDLETGQAGNDVTHEEMICSVVGARCPAVLSIVEETKEVETERDQGEDGSVKKPLLLQQHVLGEVKQIHRPVTQTGPADGADQNTSVQQELHSDNTEQPQSKGTSVGSQRNSDNLGDNECPICSELYDSQGDHRMALLNCDHTLCHCCLATILKRAADPSRVQCPLCRQKTPLLHWEIQRMQEDMMYHQVSSSEHGLIITDTLPETIPAPRLCFAMEQRLQTRMESILLCGCCLYPPRLIQMMRQMQQHCRCCYLIFLVLLFLMELSCLLVVFLPVIVLVLLFTLVK